MGKRSYREREREREPHKPSDKQKHKGIRRVTIATRKSGNWTGARAWWGVRWEKMGESGERWKEKERMA